MHEDGQVSEEENGVAMNKYLFEEARKLYPGTRRGSQPEWDNFEKKYRRRLNEICPLLKPAIEAQMAHRGMLRLKGDFCPEWKHFKTWINGEWWTEEVPQTDKPKKRKCGICSKPSTRSRIVYFTDGAATVYRCDDCEFPENVR